ncbi:FAD-binding oxidoreductase [Crossiella sp. SN42]|uniref:FAD-binding oxidoreductase n=1 Tax=Crossiella sp. SN42 TaxID=2944808 RepID=UPI00207D2C41|nr:FAD-binding oxidoreductase [Crossiella sp. SN42]MCO1576522.1 FAD-binding oxidoreductase [Crossiella sp. SN42]
MDRRGFLRLAGAGAAALATGACGAGAEAPPSGTTSATTTPPGTTGPPPPPDWAALRAKVPVLLPPEKDFTAAWSPFNAALQLPPPAALARCEIPEQVQECLEVARKSKIAVAARSGGHSYAGFSAPAGGLVVDVSPMREVRVQPDGTAVIGAGAKLADVYAGLARAGRALPAGSCPSVGIAGLTLGGGIGVLARKLGLTCDHLRTAQVVLADGSLRTASADSEQELFWALRGGGGGNFALVTQFEFGTVPAPGLTVFSLRFPAGSAASVLGAWQDWIGSAPPELWSICHLLGGTPPAAMVAGCYVGGAGGLNPLLDQLVSAAGARPTQRMAQPKGYLDAMRHFAGNGGGKREGFAAASRIVEHKISNPDRVVGQVQGRKMDLLFDGLGGAVGEIGVADTAFPHRKALASVQIYAPAERAEHARQLAAVTEVQSALTGLVGKGSYVNYLDAAQKDWARAYYGPNLDRLRAVATRYDPDGVFRFAQGLTS